VAAAIAAGLPTDTVLGEEDDVTVEDGKEGGEDGESEDDPDLPPKNSYRSRTKMLKSPSSRGGERGGGGGGDDTARCQGFEVTIINRDEIEHNK
jgi:hypothetical protein